MSFHVEIWTRDLFHPKEARYQAAPRPANGIILLKIRIFVKRRKGLLYKLLYVNGKSRLGEAWKNHRSVIQ